MASTHPHTRCERSVDTTAEDSPSVTAKTSTKQADFNKLQLRSQFHGRHNRSRITKYCPRTLLWAEEQDRQLTHAEVRDVTRYQLHVRVIKVLDTLIHKRHCHADASMWYPHRVRVRTSKEDWKAFKHCQRAADHDILVERMRAAAESEPSEDRGLAQRLELVELRLIHHKAKDSLYSRLATAQDQLQNPRSTGVLTFAACEQALREYCNSPANTEAKKAKLRLHELGPQQLHAVDSESSQNAPSLGSEGRASTGE